jgi:hypothetical protein
MGLLDEYGVDLNDVEAASFDVPDDIYEFEVTDVYTQNGTENWPDRKWIVIQYALGDAGKSKTEWFELPEDASSPTDKEKQKLSFFKARLIDLGIAPEETGNASRDDLIGITGTLQVFTRNSYQNIKNVKTYAGSEEGLNEFAPETPAAEPEAEKPAAKAPAKTAKAAPAARAAATTAKAAAAGVKVNPFA